MTIEELLNKVHLRYEKNIDYPDPSSEDFLVRLGYADDGITMYEKEAKEGVAWRPLKKPASIAATGNGTDPQPADFLNFIRGKDENDNYLPAIITDGSRKWTEVSMEKGNRIIQDNSSSAYVFWREAGNIRTFPALSGTMQFPYLRKATRYPLGTEETDIEIEDDMFLQEFVLAMLFLDDDNLSQYQAHMNNAKDILTTMKYDSITEIPSESSWGFGM